MQALTEREIEIEAQKYRLRTHEIRRPSRNDAEFAEAPARRLALAQAAWDRAKGIDDHLQRLSAEGIARKAEQEAEQRRQKAERDAQLQAAADEKILQPAWQAFKAAGGTAEDFEKVKPQVLEAARMQAALDAAGVAANQMKPKPPAMYRG